MWQVTVILTVEVRNAITKVCTVWMNKALLHGKNMERWGFSGVTLLYLEILTEVVVFEKKKNGAKGNMLGQRVLALGKA